MSELSFDYHCSYCLSKISPKSGLVLSCGDFLCERCRSRSQEKCSACGSLDSRCVELKQPPDEVTSMLTNPAALIQSMFDALKFQIAHYKSSLSRAVQIIKELQTERDNLKE